MTPREHQPKPKPNHSKYALGDSNDASSEAMPVHDNGGKDYAVMFKVKYQAEFGQLLCVVGSNAALGNWEIFKCTLKWTKGHVWVSDSPVFIKGQGPIFQYKYVLLWEEDKQLIKWEKGINRIGDLAVLPSISPKDPEYKQIVNSVTKKHRK